jgi:S-(hydroxymethyl)glutathione dehydrogenase/alcohol dehydrogenase
VALRSKALLLEAPHAKPVLCEIDVLDPGPHEVLVRMVASGLCATDRHAVEGTHPLPKLPIVLGHEGAGVVEAVGPEVTTLARGDHVVLALSVACGGCRQCRRGLSEHCNAPSRREAMVGIMSDGETRARRGSEPLHPFFGVGTLSEHTTVREAQAVKIDADLPLDEFCLTGCGVITGIGAAMNVADVRPGDAVVVVGAGGVGLSVIQGARISGASVIVAVESAEHKHEIAAALGATHTVASVAAAGELLAEVAPGGADVAFEVVGGPALLAETLTLTRPGGQCVMVGIPPAGTQLSIDAFTMVGNRQLRGCRGGAVVPTRDIARLVALYRSGQLRLAELIGERLDLDAVASTLTGPPVSGVARSVVSFA